MKEIRTKRETSYTIKRGIRDKRDVKRTIFYGSMFLLLAIALIVKRCTSPAFQKPKVAFNANTQYKDSTFNWIDATPFFTSHAKCRMACRHINEQEVADILKGGRINYQKSRLDLPECEKKYAVDGITKNSHHLRIVAAHCGDILTIITCIDLNQDWNCHCGGKDTTANAW